MTALPSPEPSFDEDPFATATRAPQRAPRLGVAPELDVAAATTTAFVMADHQVGWHDNEDAVTVYHWILSGTSGLPAGLQIYPTAGQAAAFLHGHRARQARDVECGWCISDLRPPPKGGETLEMLLVYLWVVATSRPSYSGDGTRVYDQGEGAGRFLHAWRLEQGLEDEDSCPICP